MKKIEVDYEMGQRVRIKANGRMGEIRGIWIDKNVIGYSVEWVIEDGTIHDRWFKVDEIRSINEESDLFSGEYEDDKKVEVKED